MPEPAGKRHHRPLWTVVVLLVLAAVSLWLSARLTWSWSTRLSPMRGNVVDRVDGATAAPALVPLALLMLAAIAASLAIGGWARRILGVLVMLVGAAAVWLGLHQVSAAFGAHPAGYPLGQIVAGHVVAAVAGLCAIAAGVVLVAAANRLPRLGAKYAASAQTRRRRDPDAELWQALSEGDDPTKAGDDRSKGD